MPPHEPQNGETAGVSSSGEVDLAALVEQLRAEVQRTGPGAVAGPGASTARLNARATADRLWRVTADRPVAGRGGAAGAVLRPVKLVVRKLARWYVEPVFADQRAFNAAVLKLLDDVNERLDRLERREP